MSEFTDLLLSIFPPEQALLFVGLAGIDYLQIRWFDSRVSDIASVGTEEQRALADGGHPEGDDESD